MKAKKKTRSAVASSTWTRAQERAFINGILRKLTREVLEQLQAEVQRTRSGLDVLRAVSWCAMRDVAMPQWLAVEFMARYRAVTHRRVASWDDAFGRPLPKGAHLAKRRKEHEHMLDVYWLVEKQRRRDRGIGKVLFGEVADELGLNATEAEAFYYKAKRMLGR